MEVLGIGTEVIIPACEAMDATIRGVAINESGVKYNCVYWHANERKEVWLTDGEFRVTRKKELRIGFR